MCEILIKQKICVERGHLHLKISRENKIPLEFKLGETFK